MAKTQITGARIAAICTSVPSTCFDNLKDATEFSKDELKKVTSFAGITARRVADDFTCSSDLCEVAANRALEMTGWERDSVDALIMVTQSPDYFTPSTACILQDKLGLSDSCAAFDVGVGCSGYPYGLWLTGMMLQCGDLKRVLLLHGETPARFAHKSDRSVFLLFGDAGSATAIEAVDKSDNDKWSFVLHSDGSGYQDLIIESGGFRDRFPEDQRKYFVKMNGASILNFTIKRVPDLVKDTLSLSGMSIEDIDYFIFHQSNRFIIKNLINKMKIPKEKVPLILEEYGNTGGVSLPLTITKGNLKIKEKESLDLLLLGYGAGLSWASALIRMSPDVSIDHIELQSKGDASHADKTAG